MDISKTILILSAVVIFFLGVTFKIAFDSLVKRLLSIFTTRLKNLLDRYILSTGIFILSLLIVYSIIFYFIPAQDRFDYLQFISDIAFFLFASYIGYFAFQQAQDSRFDTLLAKAKECFSENEEYKRAAQFYEEAIGIKKDFEAIAECCELYYIQEKDQEFREKFELLKPEIILIEEREVLIKNYLEVLGALMSGNIENMRQTIFQAIDIAERNKKTLEKFNWGFKEIKKSSRYSSTARQLKQILDKYISWLDKPNDQTLADLREEIST